MSIRWPFAPAAAPLPYGTLERNVWMVFGKLSDHIKLIRQFIADARAAMPNECAGVLVWSETDEMLSYHRCESITADPGSVKYQLPPLKPGEYVAVDLHSHGSLRAFFSGTDDADDAGSVKIAGVIGKLDAETPSAEFRLCVHGLMISAPVPEGLFA
jgi:PRTRC genetic system protein A